MRSAPWLSVAAPLLPQTAGSASATLATAGAWRRASSSASPASDNDASGLSTTANSYVNLGAFVTMGGDVGRAATGIAYMQEALQLQEEAYASEADPRRRSRRALGLAQSLMQVGRQHHQQQDAQEALALFVRAQGLAEEFLAAHQVPASSSADDANSSSAQADAAVRKAVEYGSFVLSEICSNIGVATNDLGQPDKALEMHQRALTLRKETVGKTHPSVAECLNNLGAVFFARGAFQKAAEHYEQALELLVESAGGREDGPYMALSLYNIGVSRAHLGQPREAGAALRRALRLAEQAFGPDHRQVDLIRATMQQYKGPSQDGGQPSENQEPSSTSAEGGGSDGGNSSNSAASGRAS